MFKKRKKQKLKIAKLTAKETELREKLEAVLQEKSAILLNYIRQMPYYLFPQDDPATRHN